MKEEILKEFDERFPDLHSDDGGYGDNCSFTKMNDEVRAFVALVYDQAYGLGRAEAIEFYESRTSQHKEG